MGEEEPRVGRLRTLIVGAGVAGLTLAALLRRQGERPVIVERAVDLHDTGYMLGMYPLGSRVLHGLGLYSRYLKRSAPMSGYSFHDGSGRQMQYYEIGKFLQRYGDYQAITRGDLVGVLLEGIGDLPLRFGTTVESFRQSEDEVTVTFNDGCQEPFDLVVGADGLHSRTRAMLLEKREYAYWEAGWGGWVCWADASLQPADTYSEMWGSRRFLGLYPVPGHLGVFVGGARTDVDRLGWKALANDLRARIKHFEGPISAILDAAASAIEPFYWSFQDCRTRSWQKGRMVLLGDAAVGFLPTAGVGASIAMDAAAALSDELSRTDAAHVPYALELFVKRQRPRAEAAQTNSRYLAHWMMVNPRPLAWVRDRLLRFYSVNQALADIAKVMAGKA